MYATTHKKLILTARLWIIKCYLSSNCKNVTELVRLKMQLNLALLIFKKMFAFQAMRGQKDGYQLYVFVMIAFLIKRNSPLNLLYAQVIILFLQAFLTFWFIVSL